MIGYVCRLCARLQEIKQVDRQGTGTELMVIKKNMVEKHFGGVDGEMVVDMTTGIKSASSVKLGISAAEKTHIGGVVENTKKTMIN